MTALMKEYNTLLAGNPQHVCLDDLCDAAKPEITLSMTYVCKYLMTEDDLLSFLCHLIL